MFICAYSFIYRLIFVILLQLTINLASEDSSERLLQLSPVYASCLLFETLCEMHHVYYFAVSYVSQ